MPNLAAVRESLPFLRSVGEFFDLSVEDDSPTSTADASGYQWIKDFKLGCFIITSLGIVAKSVSAIAKVVFPLVRLTFLLSAAACLISIVVNVCWLIKAHQEEKKPLSTVQKLTANVRNFVSQRLHF